MNAEQTDTDATVDAVCDGSWNDIPFVKDTGKTLEPEGVWNGVVSRLQFVGIQPSLYKADGQPTMFVGFEFDVSGKRMSKWRRYNYSLNNKGAFYALVVGALGKTFARRKDGSFDARLLVGRPVMVEIGHKEKGGKTYADVGMVTRHHSALPELQPTTGFETPQWVLDIKSRRLDKLPPAPASPVPASPAATAPAASPAAPAAPDGDDIEKWAEVGYCQAGKEEDVGVGCDA